MLFLIAVAYAVVVVAAVVIVVAAVVKKDIASQNATTKQIKYKFEDLECKLQNDKG